MNKSDRFFQMLNKCPRITYLWDKETQELDVERFERDVKGMSSGEIHLAKFFAGVWFNNNRYGFDLIAAMQVLDTNNQRIISAWIEHPFFP